ncbi:MAG: SH3 domain-containing protein [Desulfovibrio sp.]|jgi:cell wall-associated NlpC family hydrolase|nr:SH3 domain-containing protein [Desulfovibrio sp.]
MKSAIPAPAALLILLPFLLLVSCARPGGEYSGPPCLDVLELPQDLNVYSGKAGGNMPLLAPETQTAAAARQKELFYKPWSKSQAGPGLRKLLRAHFNLRPEKAYINEQDPFPAQVWAELAENCNEAAYGQGAAPAITVRRTDLRAMPTRERFYLRPDLPGEGYPFDYFQHSALQPGVPLYISNISRDGAWVLAENASSSGWLPAADVAGVDAAFMQDWQSRPLAALLRDHTQIGEIEGGIGALLPLARTAGRQGLVICYPRREASGMAGKAEFGIGADAVAPVPLTLSADNVARIGNAMLGQPYAWGNLDRGRDCSGLTQDLFTPFGIFLPRNSASQSRAGRVIPLTGLSLAEKEAVIKREGAPFRTLIGLKGHIALYLGYYQDKGLMFHNIWGLRTRDASGGCDNRAIVGKAVVTSLMPGIERPDLCSSGSLLERVEKATILPADFGE